MELKPGSESYKNWQSTSSPVYMQYFMFNVTNPKDIENGGKPFVKQLGPYSYRFAVIIYVLLNIQEVNIF